MSNNSTMVRRIRIYDRETDLVLNTCMFLEIEKGDASSAKMDADVRLEFVFDENGQALVRNYWPTTTQTDLSTSGVTLSHLDGCWTRITPGMKIRVCNECSQGTVVCWIRGNVLVPVYYNYDQDVPETDPDAPRARPVIKMGTAHRRPPV